MKRKTTPEIIKELTETELMKPIVVKLRLGQWLILCLMFVDYYDQQLKQEINPKTQLQIKEIHEILKLLLTIIAKSNRKIEKHFMNLVKNPPDES